jgi:hypothetical protein
MVFSWKSGDDFVGVPEVPQTKHGEVIPVHQGRILDLSSELAKGGTFFIMTWKTDWRSDEYAGRRGFRLPMK